MTLHCQKCNASLEHSQGISTQVAGKETLMCDRCFNAFISEMAGLDFKQIELHPLKLKDCHGKEHTFVFQTIIVPVGLVVEAKELLSDDEIGYEFSVLGPPNAKHADLVIDLYQKMKRGLSKKYLELRSYDEYRPKDSIVAGRIDADPSGRENRPQLCIDGKKIDWDDFGRMVLSHEGWQFKMEFIDQTDEV